jgi:metal-sulfur cluster biosynthetic enzyme
MDHNRDHEAAIGPAGEASSSMSLTPENVLEALKEVIDPELAINIVDLGLIYEVEIEEDKSVLVKMTLTSPGCPVGPMLQAMTEGAVRRNFPEVEDARAQIVWIPPWDPYTMASEEAKDMLGIW